MCAIRAMRFVLNSLVPLLAALYFATTAGAERLRVASLNTRNYATVYRRVAGRGEPDYPKPETEKAALRLVIAAANADVLALQEIGGAEFVEELRRDLAREGLEYAHSAVLAGPDKKRQLAFLSRRPLKRVRHFPDLPTGQAASPAAVRAAAKTASAPAPGAVSRGLLLIVVETGAGDVEIATLHLKSRLSSDPADPQSATRRLAEADAVCRALANASTTGGATSDASASGGLLLLCGDFNDGPASKTLRRFTDGRRAPALRLLTATDGRGETWTYRNRAEDYYSRSDYFLHSPAMGKFLRGNAKIADLPAADAASDHRLIFADFYLPDAPAAAKSPATPPAPR